jgi:hypothetical protein
MSQRAADEALGVLDPPGGVPTDQHADRHRVVRRRRRVLLADLPAGRMGIGLFFHAMDIFRRSYSEN